MFTLGDLRKVCAKLEGIYKANMCAEPKRGGWEEGDQCARRFTYTGAIETIRKLAEVVVYGEAQSEAFFELFAETNMMGLLVRLWDAP